MPALTGNVYQMADNSKGLDIKNRYTPSQQYQEVVNTRQKRIDTLAKESGIELRTPTETQPSLYQDRIQSALDTIRLWRGPDYVFSTSEAKTIEALLEGSDNPDETLSRFIASSSLASLSGYDVKTVYDNLDEISQFYTGKDYMPSDATLFEKVNASFKLVDAQRLMGEYKNAYMSGDYQKASQYESQVQAILDDMGDTLAGVPQSTLDSVTDVILGNVGYIADMYMTGSNWAKAAGIALTAVWGISLLNPISAAITSAAIPVFMAGAAGVGTFMESTRLAEAQTFWDMMHDPETVANPAAANVTSLLNGLFVGATETFLDGLTARGISKAAGKKISNLGVSMLVDTLSTKGSNRFAYSLLDWVTGGVDEALLNEFPQQAWDYITNVAYKHMSGVPADFDFGEMMSESFKAAADGLLVGLAYGSAGIPFAMRSYNNLSLDLRRKANATFSREDFFASTSDLKPESMSRAAFEEAQSRIWDASVIQREEYMARNYAGTVLESMETAQDEMLVMMDEDGNPITPDGTINRTAQGRLFAWEDANPVETTVYFGDAEQGTVYGAVSFSDRGDSVKINGVRVSPGYESLRPEMMTQVFADYGINKDIEWNPTSRGLVSVKKSLIDNNPDKTGLNYKAHSVKANTQALADQIQKNMPSLSRPEALVSAELYLMGDRGALSANNNGQVFGDAAADGIDLQGRRGATNIAKSIIYAAKNSDVTTFTHELFHAAAAVRPAERKELADAVRNTVSAEESRAQLETFIRDHEEIWDKLDMESVMKSFENLTGTWTREQEENLARLYEAYRSSSKSQRNSLPEKIREVLRRLADYIGRIYQTVKDTVPLNEDIAKAFDRITGIEKPSSKTGRPDDGVLYQDAIDKDFRKTEDNLRKEKSNFDSDGRHLAPNGKPSNLPYTQWVMVRTPAFKKWFGDWENDPQNSSKVIDENGEPKIVYHGTDATDGGYPFTEFEWGDSYSNTGAWFSDDMDVAWSYGGDRRGLMHLEWSDEDGAYVNLGEGDLYGVFLNLRSPEIVDAEGRNWDDVYGDGEEWFHVEDLNGYPIKNFTNKEDFEFWKSTTDLTEGVDYIVTREVDDSFASTTRDVVASLYEEQDGAIFHNIVDIGRKGSHVRESMVYVVTNTASQVKSIDNRGTFLEEEDNILFQTDKDYSPEKVGHGYKLFEQDTRTGKLYPLFIGSREETPIGEWLIAQNLPTKGFANRPGWHIGSSLPDAPWLKGYSPDNPRGIFNSKRGKNFRRVWAEVSYPMDIDYQKELDERGIKDIKDHVPTDGYYTFREANGTWVITGALKVDRILSEDDRQTIFKEAGYDEQEAWEAAPSYNQRKRQYEDSIRFQDDYDPRRYTGIFRRAGDPVPGTTFDPATPQEAVDAVDYLSPVEYPDWYGVTEDGKYIDELIDPANWDKLVTAEELGIKPETDYTKLDQLSQMEYTYEEAVAATLPDARYVGSDSAKDAQFIEAMDDPETFYRYMYLLGDSLNLNRNGKNGYKTSESARIRIEPYTDQNHREQIQAMANARVTDLDIREVAKAWNMNQDVDPARVETARKKIKKDARIWRDFFADLTGNADMKPNTLIEGRLNVKSESDGNYRSIDELAKIAQEAGFSEVEAKLRNGTLKMSDVDTETEKRIKEQIRNLRRQYDSTTKANAKLNETVKDLKAAVAERVKEKDDIDKKIDGIIKLLNRNVPRDQRLKISAEYVKLSEELDFLEHGKDLIWNTQYKPSDGRSLRGHKVMRSLQESADRDWRGQVRKRYGLENLNEIKKRKREITDRLETIKLSFATDIARNISRQIDNLNIQLGNAQATLDKYKSISDADKITITQLTDRLNALTEELREEKNLVNHIKSTENLQVANLKKQVARLQKAQANFDNQIEATVGRMEAQYEAMVRRAQSQRDEIIEKQKQRRALEEIRAEKTRLAKEIMDPVNLTTTDWETGGQAIMAIQAMIDPEFRRDWVYDLDVNLEGEAGKGTMTIPEAQNYFAHLDDEGRQAVIDALSPQVIARLTGQRKPLNDWTVDELRQMAGEVYMLRKLGRETLRAKNAFLQEQAKYIVKSMLGTLRPMAGDNLRNMPGSQESEKHAKNPKTKISQMIYSSRRPQELAQLIDGGYGKKGPAYNLLVDEKRHHQNQALRRMDERYSVIDPMVTEETAKKLAKTHTIDFGDGYRQTFTADDLAYIWLSQYEPQNRAAVAFGVLLTQEEKGTGIPRGLDEDGRPYKEYLTSSVIADDEVLERTGWDRYRIALDQAAMVLQEEGLMDFVEAIEKDLNGQGGRLQKMMVSTFNQPIHLVEHYLPIKRKDLTGENLDVSADAILNYGNSAVMHNPEKGFTIKRVNIAPRNQTPVNTSLLSVWRNSVKDQEWLIESAAYIKKLHRIFNNKEFQNALQGAYSSGLYREITDYIDLLANPYKQPRKSTTEKAFRALRGNLAAAYLGWKASGIITQAITSPMPFLSDVSPVRLIKAYMDIAEDYSTIMSEIDEKSPMMKHRSMSFVVEELAQRVMDSGNNKAIEAWHKFTQTGMKGLEWIDRVAVAGGWLAKYQEALQSALDKGLDTDAAEMQAVKAADDLVLKVQPTGDKTEFSSMFRTESEFAKAILQFTTSLNVIWNNITADLQGYLRNKEYGKVVGTLSGYMLAGLLLGVALTGYDDDDDAVDKARKTGYFALTQFMDSVPWLGSLVNEVGMHLITGERGFYGTSSMFPAANELLQALDSFVTGDFLKSLEKLGKGIGLATGLPTSSLGQIKDAIMDADPWKLIGR